MKVGALFAPTLLLWGAFCPILLFWGRFLPPLLFLLQSGFCRVQIVGALFAPTLTFWGRFLPPLCCFGGAFCPHTSKSGFSCPDWFICSLIHLVQIKLCSHKPLVVILISGWRRTVFYLISKLIILSHKSAAAFLPGSSPSSRTGWKLSADVPEEMFKWCICKHPKCQLI